MLIIKKRLKNLLNNKILHGDLTQYNIFYTLLDSSQTITNSFKKKTLTKLLFNKNFSYLKEHSFIYPVYYLGAKDVTTLLKVYKNVSTHPDFNKILICNIKLKNLIFQDYKLLKYFNIENNSIFFYKLYFLLNTLLLNFALIKHVTNTKIDNKN